MKKDLERGSHGPLECTIPAFSLTETGKLQSSGLIPVVQPINWAPQKSSLHSGLC